MFEHDNHPECIILHHSFSQDRNEEQDWFDVYKWHVYEQGWSHIGYHYGIESVNGKAMLMHGRPEWYRGAHTSEQSMNYKSIGVCIIGNYDNAFPTQEKLDVLYTLIEDIYRRHKLPLPIKMHRDFAPYKSCPGKSFPIATVVQRAKNIWESIRNEKNITAKQAIDIWAERKLSDGEKVITMPALWKTNLINKSVESSSVEWLLKKTARYIEEKGL